MKVEEQQQKITLSLPKNGKFVNKNDPEEKQQCCCKYFLSFSVEHSGAKLHAVLPDSKNIEARISKKSKVLCLRYKKVCHKWKQYLKYGSQGTGTPRDPLGTLKF